MTSKKFRIYAVYSTGKSDNVVICSNRKSEKVGSRLQWISRKFRWYTLVYNLQNVGIILQLIIQISKLQFGLLPESENSQVTNDGVCKKMLLLR